MASTGIVLVLVAHNGKTLQLDVAAQTRVDAVQQALVSFTGVAVGDQILMCHGARLDPAKPLSAYKLPVRRVRLGARQQRPAHSAVGAPSPPETLISSARGARFLASTHYMQLDPAAAEDQPVFLYHKAFLRPGAKPPPPEPVPQIAVQVPQLAPVTLRHPLEAAHSPLVRALPEYERQFEQQLVEARAYWETSRQRMHWCARGRRGAGLRGRGARGAGRQGVKREGGTPPRVSWAGDL
ncbi:hypothetical protein MNEG_15712 [Monoraphidium neglectum]|uniref:Ubiquitin-like domain-containing protein n=1 Tax=Monoraphidium neglectum TaxID=145388 RepID=A0A0D2MA47_9CHLO|nr:hypothetical protein MNEG_15712 [Monoraphidium neglectum]KIY92250.1 hypothetical protein MNEG_15712 [Monoraphidium neglectum]|eukprot:XP_013891270.1 hypothetical protein MNEG_15712 [Monoraphidium neglectum]